MTTLILVYTNSIKIITMKKFHSYLLAAAGCVAFSSCSSDDDGGNNVSADLTGTYELTSATTGQAQDYDNDGDSSTNLVLEGNCYNDSWISFHSDGTYEEGMSRTTTSNAGTQIDCDTSITSGTWTQNGDQVTTTSSANVTATYSFNSSSHTLTRTESNGQYVGWNSVSRLWANLTGNVQLTFEKYTDDDDDNGNGQDDDDNTNTDAGVFSNFNLTGFVVGQAQDLDLDGESSTNLANETNCYGNSTIKFRADGTYEQNYSYSVLNMANLSLDCETTTTTGNYTRIGDEIFTRSANGSINGRFQIGSNGKITGAWDNAEFPSYNTTTQLWATLTGNATLEFERSGPAN